ncbi:MAG: monovalent cation/H(+) antiporter subunit G [Gammaproteobacteria bacterium]|nr:MAG: monovalent cation/H(+) antiporter subunit G [Gammaproteobacteria bacterium]
MILDILSWTLLMAGSLLLIVGGVGLIRFPDFYSRVQAAGLTDTLCSIFILLGLLLQADNVPLAAKILFTLLFLLFTGPTAAHALAKTAHHDELEPWKADAGGASSKQ